MKKALVIGSSGGIGSAMSSCLAGQGYHVDRLSRRETGFDVTDQGSVAAQLSALVGPYDLIFVAIGVLAAQGRGRKRCWGR